MHQRRVHNFSSQQAARLSTELAENLNADSACRGSGRVTSKSVRRATHRPFEQRPTPEAGSGRQRGGCFRPPFAPRSKIGLDSCVLVCVINPGVVPQDEEPRDSAAEAHPAQTRQSEVVQHRQEEEFEILDLCASRLLECWGPSRPSAFPSPRIPLLDSETAFEREVLRMIRQDGGVRTWDDVSELTRSLTTRLPVPIRTPCQSVLGR
jgi:hypothetical protein